ncbi:hypothetical protein D3C71_1637690 [compost metagenome]
MSHSLKKPPRHSAKSSNSAVSSAPNANAVVRKKSVRLSKKWPHWKVQKLPLPTPPAMKITKNVRCRTCSVVNVVLCRRRFVCCPRKKSCIAQRKSCWHLKRR